MVESIKTMVKTLDKLAKEVVKKLPSANVSQVRQFRRQLSRDIRSFSGHDVVELALKILESNSSWNGRLVAYELILHHSNAAATLNSCNIKSLGAGISSWSDVDMFACYLSGPAWREHQLSDSNISRWTRSKDRWWRRAGVVSTIALNNTARGGKGDVDRTLTICRLAMNDRDDMVVKAVSWSLRELAKKAPKEVEEFVKKHQEHLAPRVLREVRNKLTTGLKNPKAKASK